MVEFEGLPPAGRIFDFNPEPEIHRKDVSQGDQLIFRKIQDTLNIAGLSIGDVYTLVSGGLIGLAYKEITVAATDLTTTVVANDTLIAASATAYEFNWNDPRLMWSRSVSLEPALGVEPMAFVMDTGAHINAAVLHAVADDGTVSHNLQMDCVSTAPGQPTYLLRRQWVLTGAIWDLDPVAWTVGQKLHLAQLRVVEATELT